MKKSIYISLLLIFLVATSTAQTAMDFEGNDCNGNYHHLFNDLDSGKAVAIIYYMANCSACPPVAKKIQAMANNVNAQYPDMVRAYAFPYVNSTTCTYSKSWVTTNNLPLFMPFDSGAVQVAHYGGFGMPTVVLLGGMDHRTMFSTLSFSTADTTEMRDSILALHDEMNPSGIKNLSSVISSFNVFPNPANSMVSINVDLKESSNLVIDVTDIAGKQIAVIANERQNGAVTRQFNSALLPNGNYLVRLQVNRKITTQNLTVVH